MPNKLIPKLKSEKLTAIDYIANTIYNKDHAGNIFKIRWGLLPLSERKRYLEMANEKVSTFINSEYKAECGRKGIKIPIKCN